MELLIVALLVLKIALYYSHHFMAVELYHASHLWYPPFYTSPMASSALKH